ncbi:MAG: mRNA-capping enzyme subunit beta [Alyxoria varia]|nr:MAG: mRNA-capping enzyme subunit beta [Alyxoria varia]
MDLHKIVNAQDEPIRPSESPQTPTVTTKPGRGVEQINGSPEVLRKERLPSISISPRTTSQENRLEGSSVPHSNAQASTPTTKPKQTPRKRFITPPIYAQRCKSTKPLPKHKKEMVTSSAPQNGRAAPNGHVPRMQPVRPVAGRVDQPHTQYQPVFNEIIPGDQVVKSVCDFLFQFVVGDDTFGTGDAGSLPPPSGQFEIEAKIGRLVDRNKCRVNFPVASETSLNVDYDVSFESSMTGSQHEHFNNCLNEEVKKSHTGFNEKTQKPRIPLQYKRLLEVDSFYKLPRWEIDKLPHAVQGLLKMPSKHFHQKDPKVRVTRNQKTGEVTAQIIKHRLKDLHVYCPRSIFDYRVSVSLELNWDGDASSLPRDTEAPDRIKNRMSYNLAFCQIDLTQVTNAERADSKSHELEVEVSSSEVKRQGKLAATAAENQYQPLVKGFIDNVRALSRLFPS